MANPGLTKNYLAGGAIAKHRIVKFDAADRKVVQAAAATDKLIGVSNDIAIADTERGDIIRTDLAVVEYGGNVARGDLLTSDANGKAVAVTRHTHTENTAAEYTQNATTGAGSAVRTIGVAEISGVAGDLGEVLICPGFA